MPMGCHFVGKSLHSMAEALPFFAQILTHFCQPEQRWENSRTSLVGPHAITDGAYFQGQLLHTAQFSQGRFMIYFFGRGQS